MCNLYSLTKGQQAIRELAGVMRDRTGNLPLMPGILTTRAEIDLWMTAPAEEALEFRIRTEPAWRGNVLSLARPSAT
jgi:hypothetical protein